MKTLAPTRSRPAVPPTGRELVTRTIAEHAGSLLATARRHSLCVDDAQDAYQRALEIFLRRVDDVSPERAAGWLRTVVRHEALAVRRSRLRLVGPEANDMDAEEARGLIPGDERAISFERLERSAEVLAGLKPHHVRALVLKAHGYSYTEICEMTGWTYTKVNRCLTEGRRAFRTRLADIEHGRECRRWEPVLSALADGEAAPGDLAAARPHLRQCAACRSTLREHRLTGRGIAVVLPLAAVVEPAAGIEQAPGLLLRVYEAFAAPVHERSGACAQKLTAAVEAATAGKVAAVAASATALAGGGVAAVQAPLRDLRALSQPTVALRKDKAQSRRERASADGRSRDDQAQLRRDGNRDDRDGRDGRRAGERESGRDSSGRHGSGVGAEFAPSGLEAPESSALALREPPAVAAAPADTPAPAAPAPVAPPASSSTSNPTEFGP
jgi:RNA polymerase sigma factor (sigma-70 family)